MNGAGIHKGTVYIAGPMRGRALWNFPAFDAARDRWVAAGWNVFNPADLDRIAGFDEHTTVLPPGFLREAMLRDMPAICQSTAIALLPGWEESRGVHVELTLAKFLGLAIYDAETMQPMNTDDDKVRHASGATSSRCPDFGQIPLDALVALAERFSLGEKKHGRDNWRRGLNDDLYVIERLNHVIYHALKAIAKLNDQRPDDGDDDAGAIMWGGAFLVEALKLRRKKPETAAEKLDAVEAMLKSNPDGC